MFFGFSVLHQRRACARYCCQLKLTHDRASAASDSITAHVSLIVSIADLFIAITDSAANKFTEILSHDIR